MKIVLSLAAAAVLVVITTGCEAGYGGVYAGVSGEYPSSYYGSSYYGPGVYPVYPVPYAYGVPYDRDHYWDRHHYWEQHRWHADSGWGRHGWEHGH